MKTTSSKPVHGWIVLSSLLLVICMVLTGIVILDHRMKNKQEHLYMSAIYYDLRDLANQAEAVSQMDSFDEDGALALYHLRVLLHHTDEDISKDAAYLTGKTPNFLGIWFSQQSSKLQIFCEAQLMDAQQIRAYASKLQAAAEAMARPFAGEDGLNFDKTIALEEFTSILSEVHAEVRDLT